MQLDIKNNSFSCDEREKIYNLVIGDHFTNNQNTGLKDVTYSIETLPKELNSFVRNDCNIYNFICMLYTVSDEVEEHVDEDLVPHLTHAGVPVYYIKPPVETTVYYIDVCDEMIGGELICKEATIQPKTNMCITFPSDMPHSVNEVTHVTRPRVTLVCEKYRLLPGVLKYIKLPWFRECKTYEHHTNNI